MRDHLPPTAVQSHSSESRQDALYSAFAQDTVTLWPERLTLVAGSKVERNDYSGWEVQPGIRAIVTPSARQTWWCSVSRAVRTPSRAEGTVRLNCMLQRPNMTFMGQPHLPAEFVADGGFGPESVIAYELGHRMQVLGNLTADLATFYNSYRDLQTLEPVAGTFPVRFVLRNNLRGEAFGAEATARWLPFAWWKLQVSYAYMDLHLSTAAGSGDIFTERTYEEDVPHHQASLMSRWNLPAGVQVDGWLRYVDPITIESISGYIEMDLRAACPIGRNVELSVAARNILHDSHVEYGPSFMLATETTEVERSVYAKLTCRFR
jgi:iron complex outermembrane receptor protein